MSDGNTPSISRRSVGLALAAIAAGARPVRAQPSNPVDVRSFGAVGDGVTDDTAALTRAHASGQALVYPKTGGYFRTTQPLVVRADVLGRGGEIRIAGNGSNNRELLRVNADAPPLTISGLVLDGEYEDGTAGEWSHAIALRSARGTRIRNNVIRRPYGDCIYVGVSDATKAPCQDIVIENNVLQHPRRCAVAVISADRVRISGNRIDSRHGYVAAIDLEPNRDGADRVHDVAITGNRFEVMGVFVLVTAGLQGPTTGVVIRHNSGRATVFTSVTRTANLHTGAVQDNTFISGAPGKGAFLRADQAEGLVVDGNTDTTPCGQGGYNSVSPGATRGVVLGNNRFCRR